MFYYVLYVLYVLYTVGRDTRAFYNKPLHNATYIQNEWLNGIENSKVIFFQDSRDHFSKIHDLEFWRNFRSKSASIEFPLNSNFFDLKFNGTKLSLIWIFIADVKRTYNYPIILLNGKTERKHSIRITFTEWYLQFWNIRNS